MATKTATIYREYPLDPKDVTAGLLGAANADQQRRQEHLARLYQHGILTPAAKAQALETRLREARRTVDTASPDSDFVAVAAAQASIPVLERHLREAQQQAAQDDESRLMIETRVNSQTNSYLIIRAEIADFEERGVYVDPERRRRLREIAGEPAR